MYAKRDATRRGHLLEFGARMGMRQFVIGHYRSLVAWLEATALQTTRGMVLAKTLVEKLRRRLIVMPSLAAIEGIAAETGTRGQRTPFFLITKELTAEQRDRRDELPGERSPDSLLSWLRMPPGAPLRHAGRPMIETGATSTDEILDLRDRLMGSFVTKSRNKYERAFAEQGKAINDKVRLYAKVGAALVEAREQGRDPFAAIEAVVPLGQLLGQLEESRRACPR